MSIGHNFVLFSGLPLYHQNIPKIVFNFLFLKRFTTKSDFSIHQLHQKMSAETLERNKEKSIENNIEFDTPIKAVVPDGGWGWVVCLSCLFGNLTVGAVCMSYGIILPSIQEYYGESTAIITLVGSVLPGLALATCPLAATLTNRFGLRPIYMIGSLLSGTSLLISTFSPNAYVLIVTYGVLSGTGLGLIILPVSVACNYYFDAKRALATGIAKTGFSIGSFVFPPISNIVLELFDWKAVVYMYAALAFSSGFFGALLKPLEVAIVKTTDEEKSFEEISDEIAKDKCKKEAKSLSIDFRNIDEQLPCNKNADQTESKQRRTSSQGRRSSLLQINKSQSQRRRSSLLQINEYMEESTKDSTEIIFKPKQQRGSGIFLPPSAKSDSFYDVSAAKRLQDINSRRSNLPKAPAPPPTTLNQTSSNRKYSTVTLSALDEGKKNGKLTPTTIWNVLVDMSFWGDHALLCLLGCRFWGHFSMVLFFMFVPSLLLDNNFSMTQASLVLTVIGSVNTGFRIIVGALMDHPRVNPAILTATGFLLQGILFCIFPFCKEYILLMVLGAVIGVTSAPYNVGLSIILGQMLPMEKVASAFGKMALAMGFGAIAGPTIAGCIYDFTKDYKIILLLGGIAQFVGGALVGMSAYLHNKRKQSLLNKLDKLSK